jgi:hypothetical protein
MVKSPYDDIPKILLILLLVRVIGQCVSGFFAESAVTLVVYIIFASCYIAALVGVLCKQKWGPALSISLALIDILAALAIGGASGVGAGIMDAALIYFAYKEFQKVRNKPKSLKA